MFSFYPILVKYIAFFHNIIINLSLYFLVQSDTIFFGSLNFIIFWGLMQLIDSYSTKEDSVSLIYTFLLYHSSWFIFLYILRIKNPLMTSSSLLKKYRICQLLHLFYCQMLLCCLSSFNWFSLHLLTKKKLWCSLIKRTKENIRGALSDKRKIYPKVFWRKNA